VFAGIRVHGDSESSNWHRGAALIQIGPMASSINVQSGISAARNATTRLCLPKRPFLLRQLMLQPTMDTLLGDDVGACLARPDPPLMGAFARRAPARVAGLAPPTERSAALAASAIAAREGGPLALGRALAWPLNASKCIHHAGALSDGFRRSPPDVSYNLRRSRPVTDRTTNTGCA
jgi:hypothetical protein